MASPKGIFVSYRRIDSQASAGRMADDLKRAFGDDAVFRDINDIAAGDDFAAVLDARLAGCGVLLAIIGPAWLDQLRLRGERDAAATIDYVRREIERALALSIDVIPVLVQGATPPEAAALPESLHALARLEAHEQGDRSWHQDMHRLLKSIEARTGRVAQDPFTAYRDAWKQLRRAASWALSPRGLAVGAAFGLAGIVAAGVYLWRERASEARSDVAFLMRPQNVDSDAVDEVQVFKDLRSVLKLALPESHVEVVPPAGVGANELDRYRQEEKEALLAYKGESGYPRIFIHTRYSVERSTGVRRVSVTPFLRPNDPRQPAWKPVEGWPLRAYDGSASRRVAIKVAFELIEFLAAKGLLRLTPEELQGARAALLDDYRATLVAVEAKCGAAREVRGALSDPAAGQAAASTAASTRRRLDTGCALDETAQAPDRSARTAAAVYGAALGL